MGEIKEIFIEGEIGTEFSAKDFANEIRDNQDKEIHLMINSPGGSLIDAFASVDVAGFRGITVHAAVINGLCASAATIFSSMAKVVSIGGSSFFLIHNPTGGDKEVLAKMKEAILDIYMDKLERSGDVKKPLSRNQVSKLMDKDELLTATEALDMGFVDMIHAEAKIAAKAEIMINEIKGKTMADEKTPTRAEKIGNAILELLSPKKVTMELKHADGVFNVVTDNEEIEGKEIDAKDGTYTLEDERTIEVENKIIKSVKNKDVDVQDAIKEGFAAITATLEEKLAPITARLDALENVKVVNEVVEEEVVEKTELELAEEVVTNLKAKAVEAEKVKAEAKEVKAEVETDKKEAKKIEVKNQTDKAPGLVEKDEKQGEPQVLINMIAKMHKQGHGKQADLIMNGKNI